MLYIGKFNPDTVVEKDHKGKKEHTRSQKRIEQETPDDKPSSAKVSARPPMRTRKQPVVEYDASCYKLNKKEGGINMTPKTSRNIAKVNVFQGMITTQLGYKSKNIESPLAERVRRNYM
jgi:hypothetical protein